MGVQLLSISHKVAPVEVRSLFAFEEEEQIQIMLRLLEHESIHEAVVIATCNRTEVYTYVEEDKDGRKAFGWMQQTVLEAAEAMYIENIQDYIRLYQDEKAVRHLFLVAAGLDSMIIGEDQILGQVKRAHEQSLKHRLCKIYLNTLFRMAVTASKKVKTDTELSKTSVSTASLALKAVENELGTLQDKKIMVIGASGKIGGIVLKNAGCMAGVELCVTVREHKNINTGSFYDTGKPYHIIAYEERYRRLNEMDAVISATTSPHFTLTKNHVEKALSHKKKRVFIDLAVPMDIEHTVNELADTSYYNIEDFKQLAEQNNEKKSVEAKAAGVILAEYEDQFFKWLLFQNGKDTLERIKGIIMERGETKGFSNAIDKLFYDIREESTVEGLAAFISTLETIS